MNCMKCGSTITGSGVFCQECLADMEKYPVKPNITVQLPVRPAAPAVKKKPRHKYIKPEDQIRHLKKVRNWLCVLLVTALLAFAAVSAIALHLIDQRDNGFSIGQNYGSTESTEES